MFDKLDSIEKRFKELEAQLSDTAVMQDMKKYSELMKEHATSKEIVDSYALYKKTVSQLEEAREMAGNESDPELKEMAKEEIKEKGLHRPWQSQSTRSRSSALYLFRKILLI